MQIGYGQLLWGSNSNSVMYGYVRPLAEVDSAGTYNSGMVALDYYPISFIGFRGGKEWIQDDTKYADYRCDLYQCTGTRYREFFQANLLAGYSIWFLTGMIRWDSWTQKHPELGDGVDPYSGLAAQALGDTQVTIRGITGLQVTPEWAGVAMLQYMQMARHYGVARLWTAGPRYRAGSVTRFRRCRLLSIDGSKRRVGSAYLGFSWEPYPTLAIH